MHTQSNDLMCETKYERNAQAHTRAQWKMGNTKNHAKYIHMILKVDIKCNEQDKQTNKRKLSHM